MSIFRGTFEYALDAKHRLTIPVKYRAALAGGAVLAFSPEVEQGGARALSIWQTEVYDARAQRALANLNPLRGNVREAQRLLYNDNWDVELDSASRIVVPPPALAFAGLEKDVVVTGSGECLEVWDRATYRAYSESLLSRFPEIAASIDHPD